MTTAEAGFEQGVKFDPDVTGLEYWVLVAEGKADSRPLRDLLSSEISNVNLKDFLKNASDLQFCEELLTKIKWDLGSRDMEALQTLIENKLKTHGNKVGVSITPSVRVLPHLLKYVADLLTTKTKKSIWYADFLTEFEKATTELVPRGTLEALQNEIVMQRMQLSSGSSFHATLPTFSPPIPLVQGALNRNRLVDSVKLKLSTCKVLFLHGSSGVGKTNLAAMCTYSMGGSWLWASFRSKPIEQLQQILVRAVDELESLSQPISLVLDDLELDQISVFERELISLIFTVSQAKGYVLITTINNPPLHLFPKLWLPNDAEELVPYFDEAEVSELIYLNGLNDLEQRKGWARVIFLMTSGHPQLVHARVRTLCAKGWPAVTYSEFLDRCDDIERVRAEARQRLLQEFPNEATRILAYRLSLIVGGFSRKLALAVAFAAPKVIQMAGEAFDNLVGPWIEMETSDRFRVSPLLKGAAESNLSQDEINSIHTAIAKDYLSKSTLDQFDVGTAFYHGFFAKHLPSLLKLAGGILAQETAQMSLLYDAMSWFSYVAMDEMQRIVPEDPILDLYLRLVQFKLTLGSPVKESAQRVIPFIEAALNEINDSNLKVVNRLLGYGLILNNFEVYIAPSEVIRMLSCIMDAALVPELSDLYDGFKANHKLEQLKVADNRPEQLLFSLQAARIRDVDDLLSLIIALEQLPKAKRDILLAVCESETDFSNILIAQAWWKESQSQKLDTKKAISKLREIELKVRKWNQEKLTIACLVAISVIHDEYEHDFKSAIDVLDNGDKEFVNSAFLLNQRAKVLFNADRSLEALSVAEQALGCSDLPDVEYIFTCRNAAIAASKLQSFEKAANFFIWGANRALVSDFLKPIGVGLLADSAYEYWLAGDKLNSISKLVETLKYLEEIPITENIKTRHLHATTRHCISWIHFQAIDKKNEDLIATPITGMCSNQEPNEGIKDHKIIDISAVWLLLYQTELALGLDCGAKQRASSFSEKDLPFFIAAYQRLVDLNNSLRVPPWDKVVTAFVRAQESMVYSQQLKVENTESQIYEPHEIPSLGHDYWNSLQDWSLISHAFLAACINCLAYHSEVDFPIENWRNSLKKLTNISEDVNSLLDVLEGADSDGSLFQEIAKGLFNLQHKAISASELWMTTFRILNGFERFAQWEKDVEVLVSKHWSIVLENQKFAFSTPILAIEAIRNVLIDQDITGYKKVALIAKVSGPYLSIAIQKSGSEMLDRLIQKQE